jgi:glutamyl-tRNA synthetase/glutamyl-Q tRNA(Asp) synthetase
VEPDAGVPAPCRIDLAALRARLPARPRTRFAPSPTGLLHLGHVVNAIFTWGVARNVGATVVLRLEDHDRTRCRPEFEAALLDDLEWLGFEPDEGDTHSLRLGASRFRQSDNDARYQAALDVLRRRTTVFACDCSRRDIAAASGPAPNEEPRYTGRCVGRGLAEQRGRALRAVLPPGLERFDDACRGAQEQDPAGQCGALLVRDRHGFWTYQFAVATDDHVLDIDLIVRGQDLLSSTGRQLTLLRWLGCERAPVYLHHPLLYRADGSKLSKANRDAGVRDLRAAGHAPENVIGRAAHAVGLIDHPRPIAAADVGTLFTR